jgi:hypothetical protein
MENQTNNWKSYVDWWPTYLILGISVAYLVNRTKIVQKLTNKLFKNKNKVDFIDSED